MKKLIAGLLTLILLLGIVPATIASEVLSVSAAQPKSIKVLAIGEDFSRSSVEYLYSVLDAEGYSDIVTAYLHGYSGDDSITGYVTGIEEGKSGYAFESNSRDFADTQVRYSLKKAIEFKDWDYIVLNTTPVQSGQESEFAAALDTMIAYIKQHKTNPNAKIGWHMNWAYNEGNTVDAEFASVYGGKPDTMYEAISKTAKNVAKKVDFVVPVGTAIMNMKSSYIGDVQVDSGELATDLADLNEMGKLIASYAWYAALSGNKLEKMNYTDAFLFNLSSADQKVIVEAVNNANKTPYALTESSYKTEPTQYNATVNGTTSRHLPGDVITISTDAALNAERKFQNWSVVKGDVRLADANAQTTTFKMPAQDVEVKAIYEAEAVQPGQLKVGFGRADVTPDQPTQMWGYANWQTRRSTGRLSEEDGVEITAVALSSGGQPNILITMDFLYVPMNWDAYTRAEVEKKFGIPGDNVAFSATHTHSSVCCGDHSSYELRVDSWYYHVWMEGMLSAIETALNDMSLVSETKIHKSDVLGMNFRRHWRFEDGSMESASSELRKTNSNPNGAQGYIGYADREMQIVRFVREDKKDVVMVNWGAHLVKYAGTGDETQISADFPGYMRRYVEAQDGDCQVAYFTGPCGNVNPSATQIGHYLRVKWNINSLDVKDYGEKLGAYVLKFMENMTTVDNGAVRSVGQNMPMIRRWLDYTIYPRLDAVSVGSEISFVTAPSEMFSTLGESIKERSPYDITFIMTCGEHVLIQYLPDWQTWFYPWLGGGNAYEALNSSTKLGQGAGEDMVDSLVGLLNVLWRR